MLALDRQVLVMAGPTGKTRVTPIETAILSVLMALPGEFVRSAEIIERVWRTRGPGKPYETLRVHVVNIRRKFPRIGLSPDDIEGMFKEGYRLRGCSIRQRAA